MIHAIVFAVPMFFIASLCNAASERTSSLNFEEQVIEGVNKKAFDSYSQFSEKNKKGRKIRLYKVRDNFNDSTRIILRETEVAP